MPYFGLTSAFLSSPLFKNSVRLTPVSVCAMLRFRCAAYSGLTVRHTPVFAILKLSLDQLKKPDQIINTPMKIILDLTFPCY